jgi:desampylase
MRPQALLARWLSVMHTSTFERGAPLVLSGTARAAIVAHAKALFPQECCGALLGPAAPAAGAGCLPQRLPPGLPPGMPPRLVPRPGRAWASVNLALPLPNSAPGDATQCFVIAPSDLLRASRVARDRALELQGFFHSHPNGDARPSPADLQGSPPWPGLQQIIVSIDATGQHELCAYESTGAQWLQRPIL